MTSIGDVELRSIVKFCVALEKSSTETMKMINSTGKYKKCSPATVYRWHAPFKEGRNSIEDDRRCGRQSVVACSIKDSVKDMINCDRRTTVRAIADELAYQFLLYTEYLQKSSWISRHRKCIEIAGDYVEKVRRSMDFKVA